MRWIGILAGCCFGFWLVAGSDWTQWRGPGRDGLLKSFAAPDAWPDVLETVWEVDAGAGYAGPLVSDGRIYVFSRFGEEEQVAAYELNSGAQIWAKRYSAPFKQSDMARMHGNGPFATPSIAGDLLVTIGMTEVLSAFNLKDGELKWRIDFPKDHGGGGNGFGSASSPLIIRDRCLVQVAKGEGGAVYCIDLNSGRILWQRENQGQASTPLVAGEVAGEMQVIAKSSKGVGGFRLADGDPLWETEYRIRYDHPIVTPILEGENLYLGDYSRPTTKWRLVQASGQWRYEPVWENPFTFYMASPVKVNNRLFGFTNQGKGQFVCLDAESGKTIWESEGRMGENAMLVAGDRWLFGLTQDGQFRVLDGRGEAYREVANYRVSELPTWGPPVVLEDGLLIKDTGKMKRLAW